MSDTTELITLIAVGGIAYYILHSGMLDSLFSGGGGVGGSVIWDSNIHGKWNNGKKRDVTGKEGNQSPDGKGFYTAASGNPHLVIDGDGIAHLKAGSGHGRIYINAINFNSRLELEFRFESSAVDNLSIKVRSRHGEGGSCENRFGGFGTHVERNRAGFKTEICHNNHENSIEKDLPFTIKDNQWYKLVYECKNSSDNKQVLFKLQINGQTVLTGKHSSPKSYYMNKSLYDKQSYFWIRSNNSGSGSIGLRNVRMLKI